MTSTAFEAVLPESITDEQLAKVYTWGRETCTKSDVFMRGGRTHLLAVRKEPKTARDFQRLLRTNFHNWGIELPPKQAGWLKLVSADDFEEIRKPERSAPPKRAEEYRPSLLELPANLLSGCAQASDDLVEKNSLIKPPVNLLRAR